VNGCRIARIPDCIDDRVELAVPQPPEWQRIGKQIDPAFIFARADFVNVHGLRSRFTASWMLGWWRHA